MRGSEGRAHARRGARWISRGAVVAALLAACLLANVASAYGVDWYWIHVYRFYNARTGAHLYTTDSTEYTALANNRAFRSDGLAYTMWSVLATTPLHRFYNFRTGVHFYSADPEEVARVQRTMSGTYRYEGVSYNVGTTGIPVHRFLNVRTGVHFYSADAAEVESVKTNLSAIYHYEGIAFYAPQYIDWGPPPAPLY
jgi:hypothetical protein